MALGTLVAGESAGGLLKEFVMPNSESKRVRHGSRHPEVVARLQRSRDRLRSRRQSDRERERVVAGAIKQYIAAWSAVRACEARRENDIEALQQKIVEIRRSVDEEIMGHRRDQGAAAVAIRDQGLSDVDVAELLEVDPKQLRQLLTAARAAATDTQQDDRGHRLPQPPAQADESKRSDSGSRTDTDTDNADGNVILPRRDPRADSE